MTQLPEKSWRNLTRTQVDPSKPCKSFCQSPNDSFKSPKSTGTFRQDNCTSLPLLVAHRSPPNTSLAKSSAKFVTLIEMLLTCQWQKMRFTIVQRTRTFHCASEVPGSAY